MRKLLNVPGRSEDVINSFLDKDISKQILKEGKVRVPKYYCPDLKVCHNNIKSEILELE